ncbi:MAG: hypothetical protein K5770_19055 [Lachnospiraceae bacterium]|nr:hypothetical protein [Lachnospiraceae bacterium]
MTAKEARRIAEEFEQKQVHTEEEEFLFTEEVRFHMIRIGIYLVDF